ncbi:MAG: hypothetical protein RIR31_661, partial [Bacteroidota bacterium]
TFVSVVYPFYLNAQSKICTYFKNSNIPYFHGMNPTKDQLLEQYNLLRTEYIKLLNDKDVLLNWGKPQLEALYSTRIGIHQIERLQMQLRIQAMKRKIELVQGAINRNEPFDVNEIELQVGEELARAELNIMQQAVEIEKAKTLLTNLDTPQRSAELRTLFKQLAKQLHPDANPGLTAEQTEIWHLVKGAYESGDLEKLKALQVVYEKEINNLQQADQSLTQEELTLRNESLKEGVRILNEELKNIKSVFPFTIEQQIKDEAWVETEVAQIKKDIVALSEYENELVQHYIDLINAHG